MYMMVFDVAPDWAPLERVAEVLRSRGRGLRLEGFRYVGREVAAGCPDLHVYEALGSQRYLCLDEHGCAYRYRAPAVLDEHGRDEAAGYVRMDEVETAVRWASRRKRDTDQALGLPETAAYVGSCGAPTGVGQPPSKRALPEHADPTIVGERTEAT